PLYLNILELSIGEAMFIPSGVLHAYIHGMGIELMADSDNVLRGGLTSKHVDPDELYRILNFSEYKPEIKKLPDPAPSWFTYPSGSKNFALSVMRSTGDPVLFPETGPSIVIVTQGDATIAVPGRQNKELKTGESVFIPARPSIPGQAEKRGIVFSGTFTAYVAAPGKPTDKTETENYSGSTATDTPEDLIPQ
ncbi:MAG: hypothetical protein FWF26_02205, partial [Treponema sp.]|nr:hypothetical protein [Treponema sp.]